MLYKSARPIPDKRSYEFIKKNINGKNIYKRHLPKDFCQSYFDWILQTKLNYLYNLDKFKSKQLWQWFNCRASELRGFPLPESKEVYSKQLTL